MFLSHNEKLGCRYNHLWKLSITPIKLTITVWQSGDIVDPRNRYLWGTFPRDTILPTSYVLCLFEPVKPVYAMDFCGLDACHQYLQCLGYAFESRGKAILGKKQNVENPFSNRKKRLLVRLKSKKYWLYTSRDNAVRWNLLVSRLALPLFFFLLCAYFWLQPPRQSALRERGRLTVAYEFLQAIGLNTYRSMAAMVVTEQASELSLTVSKNEVFFFFFASILFFVFSFVFSLFRLFRVSFYYIPHEQLPVNWLASSKDGITYRQSITRPCGGVGPAGTHDGFVLMIHHMRPPMEMLRGASALTPPRGVEVQGIPENNTTLSLQRGSCCNLFAIELSSRGLHKPWLSLDSMVKISIALKDNPYSLLQHSIL